MLLIGGFNGQSVFDEAYTLDLGGSAFLPQITNFVVSDPRDIFGYEEDDQDENAEEEAEVEREGDTRQR